MMSPSQLADLLLSPLISCHMEAMVARMAAAMAYHRDTRTSIANLLGYRNGDRLLTPRLYTEDKYCASLSVDYVLQVTYSLKCCYVIVQLSQCRFKLIE